MCLSSPDAPVIAAAPAVPLPTDPTVQATVDRNRQLRNAADGLKATILAGPGGGSPPPTTGTKMLTGQ